MRRSFCTCSVILTSLYVGGCHRSEALVNPHKDQVIANMDSNQMLLLSEGRIPSFESGYVWKNLSEMYDSKFVHLLDYNLKGNKGFRLQDHIKEGLAIKVAYLRNPGANYFVIHLKGGRPLTAADQTSIEAIAKKEGLTVLKDGAIPFKFGPDGKTPIVLKDEASYWPEENMKVVDSEAVLDFPDTKSARAACDYMDRSIYSPKVEGSRLTVSYKAPKGSSINDQEEFSRLAQRFDGKFDHSGYSETVVLSPNDLQNHP